MLTVVENGSPRFCVKNSENRSFVDAIQVWGERDFLYYWRNLRIRRGKKPHLLLHKVSMLTWNSDTGHRFTGARATEAIDLNLKRCRVSVGTNAFCR